MMKRFFLTAIITVFAVTGFAQKESNDEEENTGPWFKKENLFSGGNVNISFYSGGTVLGAAPQLGYYVSKWLDAGITFSYTYISQRDYNYNYKVRQSNIAPGAFARIFPFDFLFVNAQFEHNFIRQKIIFDAGGTAGPFKEDVNSLLVGLGYVSDRDGPNSEYYFISVSFDILNKPLSPYTNSNGDIYPVINAGFNIPLFQGSVRHRH